MLKFLGRGSAFTPEHNSAYFVDGKDLILIDCAMSAFQKLIKIDKDALTPSGKPDKIYILVTHTHGDHVGGIPMLIQYAYFVWNIPVVVGAPSEEVMEDLRFFFDRLEGCNEEAYTLTLSESLTKWVKHVIPTQHVNELDGRCFGYNLIIQGTNVVYTGDSNTLNPFMPYLQEGSVLYSEISCFKTAVHLNIEANLETFIRLTENGIDVYLMHMDNEEKIKSYITGTKIKMAPLYDLQGE